MPASRPASLPTGASVRFHGSGVAAYPAGTSFGPRRMRDFEFVWVMLGSGVAHFDQKRLEAPADSLLLCRPGMTDRYDWDPRSRTVHAFIHFGCSTAAGPWKPGKDFPLKRSLEKEDLLKSLFRFCLRKHDPALNHDCLKLMLKLFQGEGGGLRHETPAALNPSLDRALDFVRSQLERPQPAFPSAAQIARESHVSVEHLSRLFKRQLNLGPAEYVRLLRMDRAASLLSRSNLSVTEISDALLFSSPHHFSRAFKTAYKLPPLRYRLSALQGKLTGQNPAVDNLLALYPSKFLRPS